MKMKVLSFTDKVECKKAGAVIYSAASSLHSGVIIFNLICRINSCYYLPSGIISGRYD